MKRIHILRPGTFRSAGAEHTFSESDLRTIASAYDPATHEAPIVVGHPRDDSPAFGWVGALTADARGLHAAPRQVAPAFAEAVAEGRYKKVSAKLYAPEHPHNPTPDAWSLRHVGFLGGQPPVVKGLAPVQFADDGADCVTVELELAETPETWRAITRLFRGVREWIVSTSGVETADRVLPDWDIEYVGRAADDERSGTAIYSEPAGSPAPTGDSGMTDEEKAAKDQEIADLKAQNTQLVADSKARAQRTAMREAVTYAETLESEGRILPRDRDAVVALQMALPEDSEVEFSEADDADPVKKPARTVLRDILKRSPVQVDFSERAPASAERTAGPAADFRVADGVIDPDRADIHTRAVQFAEEHDVDYDAAVDTIIARQRRAAR